MRWLFLIVVLMLATISGCALGALGLVNPDIVSDQIPHHH